MTKRVSIWITDEDFDALRLRAGDRVRPHELATAMVCRALGRDVPKLRSKGLKTWVIRYEIQTRTELSSRPRSSDTLERVRAILSRAEGPMSTREIWTALGWKGAYSLIELMVNSGEIGEVPPPENRPRRRGRPSRYWALN